MIKLYGHANNISPNSFKLRVALAEVGAPYEYVPVDLAAGEQRTPAFLAINPHGKVPVLVDGDFALPESDAILWYLAETHPAAGLLGPGPRERARAHEWCDFVATALYSAYYDRWSNTVGGVPEKRVPAVAESAVQRLERSLAVMENVLGTRAYLAGAAFSIADIAGAAVMRASKERLGLDASAWPRITEWLERISARPSWKRALQS